MHSQDGQQEETSLQKDQESKMPKRIWETWEHYCRVEKSQMGVGKNEPCNWCGEEEPKPKYKGRFWMYPAKKFGTWEESQEYYRQLDENNS